MKDKNIGDFVITGLICLLIGVVIGAVGNSDVTQKIVRTEDSKKIIYCSSLNIDAKICSEWVLSGENAEVFFGEKSK